MVSIRSDDIHRTVSSHFQEVRPSIESNALSNESKVIAYLHLCHEVGTLGDPFGCHFNTGLCLLLLGKFMSPVAG